MKKQGERMSEMEVSYKKDGNSNFMILKEQAIDESDYRFQMIMNNHIKGLVPMSVKSINNQQDIYYETTSLVSIESAYSKKRMSGEDIYNLIKSIRDLSDTISEYLLNINNIIFDTAYVYVKKQEKKYNFCYYPKTDSNFQENLREFFDKLLEFVNHNDRKAVLIAYGIQKVTIGDNFTVRDLLDCAERNIRKYEREYSESHGNEGNSLEAKGKKLEIKYEKLKKENEEERKNIFQRIVKIFNGKSRYKDEDWIKENQSQMSEFGSRVQYDSKEDYDRDIAENDFDSEAEEATMLLTGRGLIRPITLKNLNEEKSVEVTPDKFPYVLGKSKKSSDFYLDSPAVSRVHLRISEDMEGYFVEDLNSTNGTFVNGIQLAPHEIKEINGGDRITLADMEFVVEQNF